MYLENLQRKEANLKSDLRFYEEQLASERNPQFRSMLMASIQKIRGEILENLNHQVTYRMHMEAVEERLRPSEPGNGHPTKWQYQPKK